MQGMYNRLLKVDLSGSTSQDQTLPDMSPALALGGKGLAARLLWDLNPGGCDPLGPDNHLIIAGGAATGSGIWGSCRHGIYCKSPQTGFFSESYSGGTVAEYLAKTGYDAIVLGGASDEPVWLEIGDEGAVIHPAAELWGLDSYAAEDSVKDWIKQNRPQAKRCGAVVIGPAGENQVAFAVIENDYWRSAGRTGVGAVMGSKKLKAIAFWGSSKKEIADAQAAKVFNRELAAKSKDDAGVKAYKSKGTPMLVDIMNSVRGLPTRYWQKGESVLAEKINADALHDRCDVTPNACLRCFIACGRLATVKQGRHQGLKLEGPEYETLYSFGALCEVGEVEEIVFLNDICDRLGMDTITAGNLAAFTIEAVRRGKVDYEIDYGQVDQIAALLKDIANRRGIGDLLARGIRAAARQWGLEDIAIHVKGMEPAGYDPRVLKGMALAYATSGRGACHLRATFYKPELAGIEDPERIEGKAEVFTQWEDRLTLFDSLILCRFYRDLYQWPQMSQIIRACNGLDWDEGEMRLAAREVSDWVRVFNLREGLTPQDDQLPKRFHQEPLPETGKVVAEEDMQTMLHEYYQARGWNQNGHPALWEELAD